MTEVLSATLGPGSAERTALVSVIIPTCNRAWALPRAVKSVFAQTYHPMECIVVDDGSDDGTDDVLTELAAMCPPGMTLKRVTQRHGGANRARNRGLRESSGTLICYLDSDDELTPDSVRRRVELLDADPGCGFAYGRTEVREADGALRRVLNAPWPEAGEARVARYLFVTSAPLIRRSLCEAVGPWYEDDPAGQEVEFFARLKLACDRAAYTYDIVSVYHKHDRGHLYRDDPVTAMAGFRMLMVVRAHVLHGAANTAAERHALAAEFSTLARRLHRLGRCGAAVCAGTIALKLAPSPRRLARLLLSVIGSVRHPGSLRDAMPARAEVAAPATWQTDVPDDARVEVVAALSPADDDGIRAWWTSGYNNWGDMVTPFIMEALSGRRVVRGHGEGAIYAVGSIISNVQPGGRLWGCGLLSRRHVPSPFPGDVSVHAVRGPLTRQCLLRAGVEAPPIYGDPVLLMPYLLKADGEPTTDIGIICHYNDAPHLGRVTGNSRYRMIDIQAGLPDVIRAVLECEAIISSSLHGLVLAEAYGRRAAWLQVDRGRHLVGRDFKFRDYLLATQRRPVSNRAKGGAPLCLDHLEWLPPPVIDLQPLLSAFPGENGLELKNLEPRDLETL